MTLLRQCGIVFGACILGEFISKYLYLPIPGNVLGMIILFLLLSTKILKINMVEDVGNFLLNNLAFFFIPAGVGLLSSYKLFGDKWLQFLLVCFISTILVMVITGYTVQFVKLLEIKIRGVFNK